MEFKFAYLKGGFSLTILYSIENVLTKWNSQLLENCSMFLASICIVAFFKSELQRSTKLSDIEAKQESMVQFVIQHK